MAGGAQPPNLERQFHVGVGRARRREPAVQPVRYYQARLSRHRPAKRPPVRRLRQPKSAKADDGCARKNRARRRTKKSARRKKSARSASARPAAGCWTTSASRSARRPAAIACSAARRTSLARSAAKKKPTCKAEEACSAKARKDWTIHHLLEDCCFLKKHDIVIGGWVAQSYTWNPSNPSDHINGPVTWTDQSNQYQLNEFYTYMYKEAKNDGEGRALGFRIDTLYGTSARFDTSAGLEDHINKSQSFYGLAIPQAYLEVAQNDLKTKIGHFISPVGYFTVGTYQNFFNTIPYTYQWGEPFTHTGRWPPTRRPTSWWSAAVSPAVGTTAPTSTRTWATLARPRTAAWPKKVTRWPT